MTKGELQNIIVKKQIYIESLQTKIRLLEDAD